MTEKELVKSINNNPEKFGEIIDLYQGKLNNFIFRLGIKIVEDREEILQDAFLKIYRNLNSYDDSMKFSTWVYRITQNTVYDFFRKQKSRGFPIELSEQDYDYFWENLSDNDEPITKKIDKKIRNKIIREIVNELPAKFCEIFILFFLEEKSYVEISDILQKNQNTIATLISRGKQQFKQLFLQKYKFSDF